MEFRFGCGLESNINFRNYEEIYIYKYIYFCLFVLVSYNYGGWNFY